MIAPKYCMVVPHYNHYDAFLVFLPILLTAKLPCIVVDDGSDDAVKIQLRDLLDSQPLCQLTEHPENLGKGAAMLSGAKYAGRLGYSHMLQIDADGQHDVADIKAFVRHSQAFPGQIISGAPQFDSSAPKARLYGRKVTDFWVALETLSLGIKDSLCGFRIYPLREFEQVVEAHNIGHGMDFDTEILVKSVWQGVVVHFINTKVLYPQNSVSHFHYLRDNLRLIYLHLRLMLGMLIRLPMLLYWRLSGRAASHL